MLRDGSEVISWLSGLEASLYVPSKASDLFSSDLLCRLRPELSRVELDKRLSELQVRHWSDSACGIVFILSSLLRSLNVKYLCFQNFLCSRPPLTENKITET